MNSDSYATGVAVVVSIGIKHEYPEARMSLYHTVSLGGSARKLGNQLVVTTVDRAPKGVKYSLFQPVRAHTFHFAFCTLTGN